MFDIKAFIAKAIKNYRTSQHLSQAEFAEECGISRNLLSLIETRNENVTLHTISLLAARMGVAPQHLLGQPETLYCVLPSKVKMEGKTYDTYGIGAIHDYRVVASMLDLSTDFNAVKSLVKQCNEKDLSLIHLQDVVEDFLDTKLNNAP